MEPLTKENYITNHDYMSFTTFSKYLSCEAAAYAHYRPEPTEALLIGSYIDSYFSNELEQFKLDHPEIFLKTGGLKANFQKADNIIKRIESDETMMYFMSGEKQVIMSGEIEGLKFKIKMDSYKKGTFITDLKVMKDFKPVWIGNRKANFIEAYNYDIELAIFQEIVKQNTGILLPCYICGITKEDPSDVAIFQIPQTQLDEAMRIVKNNIPRIKQIMNGEIEPTRCEECEYCRATKKAHIMPYDLAGLSGDQLRELGYDFSEKERTDK